MANEENIITTVDNASSTSEDTSTALVVNSVDLNKESLTLINQIIAEQDIERTKDLTYLFNVNQNKKTMVRQNKLNELLDVLTDQAIVRFTTRPDEISNKELMDGLKTVQDMIERSQKSVVGVTETTPLIQINQQTNEINVNGEDKGTTLNRDSRERVKNAVMSILAGLQKNPEPTVEVEVIDAETTVIDTQEDNND